MTSSASVSTQAVQKSPTYYEETEELNEPTPGGVELNEVTQQTNQVAVRVQEERQESNGKSLAEHKCTCLVCSSSAHHTCLDGSCNCLVSTAKVVCACACGVGIMAALIVTVCVMWWG